MERYVGKVAVVTGASSGIGSETVKELVKRGVIVVGLARRIEKLQELSDAISSDTSTYKGKFYFRQCDLMDMSDIKKSFEWIAEELGGVSILVNNAGLFLPTSLLEITEEKYKTIFDTNVKASFMCAKEAMNSMVQHDLSGHIINISSVLGVKVIHLFDNEHILYSASKHAQRAFSEGLKYELAGKKLPIKVTSICPGPVKTELWDDNSPSTEWKPEVDEILNVSDVAKACITVLDTSPYCLISDLTIIPIRTM